MDKINNKTISWDTYFMSIAILSAQRSKDPNSKVGAVLVSQDHRVLSLGYNGMPTGIDESKLSWEREADNILDTKYPYVCHAELNAILNSNHNLKNSICYVTLFPCNDCAKAIIQSGISKVIYLEDKYPDSVQDIASKKLLDLAKVKYEKYTGPILNFCFEEPHE